MSRLQDTERKWNEKYESEAVRLINGGMSPTQAKQKAEENTNQWFKTENSQTRWDWDGELCISEPRKPQKLDSSYYDV